MSTRLACVLGISLGAIGVFGAGALFLPWLLYATSSPFPGRFWATVALSIVVGRELFTSCLRMPKKVAVAPSKDWTVAAVGFSYLGERWSVQLDQAGEPGSGLVRSGPYAFIRHPIYLGVMLESVGVALFFGSPVAFAVAALCFCPAEIARARFEERVLLATLGDAYRAYRREVGGFLPRRLVPSKSR